MDFPNYASKETSALLAQLLATQSGAALQQLQAVRDALEGTARALATPVHLDQEVHELVGRLTAVADAEVARIRQEAAAAIDAMRGELQAQQTEREKVSAGLARAEAEAAILRSELQTAQERADGAERDLTITVDAHAEVEASLHKLEADWKQAQQARARVDAELSQTHETVEQLLAEVEQLRGTVERQAAANGALGAELEQARDAYGQRDAIVAQLEATHARMQALEAEVSQAHHTRNERDSLAARLDVSAARIQTLEAEVSEASAVRAHRDALAAELETRTARIQALETDLTQAHAFREQRDALAAEALARATHVRTLETELESRTARIQALEDDRTQAHALREQRDALAAEGLARAGHVQTLETELAAARDAREQLDALTSRLEAATARAEALEKDLFIARDILARRLEEAPAFAATPDSDAQIETLRGEVERMVSLFDASARAVSDMEAATNSTELLTELVKRLSLQFSRVALFRLKGNRLEGELQVGLDEAADMSKLILPTAVDSMLSRAVSSGIVQSLYGDDVAIRSGTPFGGAPTSAVALPIVLQGTTLAVVYADDAEMPESARGPAVHESSVGFARLLVGQVVVLLVRHTHELKTLAELSQYATTLLQEAKEMHAADTQAGKNPDLLRIRLKENIDCASQLYAYRAAMEGTAAAALLDEQILAELQESTAFACDLAAVIGQMTGGELRITAEAS